MLEACELAHLLLLLVLILSMLAVVVLQALRQTEVLHQRLALHPLVVVAEVLQAEPATQPLEELPEDLAVVLLDFSALKLVA